MKWRIDYSKSAIKFIEYQNIRTEVQDLLKSFILKLHGTDINIDVKKLWGDWGGRLRIRKGKIRIIFMLNKKDKIIFIEKIDFRGDVYK